MIHVTNSASVPQVWEGYTVPLGYSVLPGSDCVVYISPLGAVEELSPDYVASFGLGLTMLVPLVSLMAVRRICSILKPQTLDRFV